MACLTEFKYAVFADGELPENEARAVAAHLEICPPCRRLVDTLRGESQALVHCLQETDYLDFELEDETLNMPHARQISLTRVTLFVLAISALLRPAINALSVLDFPAPLGWLNPLSLTTQLNVLSSLIVYVLNEGGAIAAAIVQGGTLVALTVLVFAGIAIFRRRSSITNAVVSVMALLTVFSSSSYALDVRRGGQPVNVPAGETIDDTLVVLGDSVNVDGTVNGDLISFARRTIIRGTVKGSVISFGQYIQNEGTVEGSIIGFGQSIQTRGQVARNVFAFGQDVGIGNGARVAGNATLFGSMLNVQGNVGRDLTSFGAQVDVSGNVERNVSARARRVNVLAPAKIDGSFTARARSVDDVQIDPAAAIGGKRDIQAMPPTPSRYTRLSFYFWQIIWLAAALISGLLLLWLVPAFAGVKLETGHAIMMTGGIGFLALIVPPIAAVISAITLVGLPLGLMTFALWVIAAYLAKIVIAAFLGRSLLSSQGEWQRPKALTLLVGLALVFVGINLPYVGGLIEFCLIVLGLGAMVTTGYQAYRSTPSAQAA